MDDTLRSVHSSECLEESVCIYNSTYDMDLSLPQQQSVRSDGAQHNIPHHISNHRVPPAPSLLHYIHSSIYTGVCGATGEITLGGRGQYTVPVCCFFFDLSQEKCTSSRRTIPSLHSRCNYILFSSLDWTKAKFIQTKLPLQRVPPSKASAIPA